MNPIRRIVQAQIDNIIQLSDLAGDVEHNPSAGELRESYLIDFFKKLVPASVEITSGFITDSTGHVSPQIDLIVTKKTSLPLFSMKEGLSIVPVESALLVAEIKSTLETSSLEQVRKQNERISTMNISGEIGLKKFIIPSIILAYDSKVNKDTLKKWMEENGNTVSCCILKKDTLIKDVNIKVFEKFAYNIKHHGVLTFVSTFHGMLEYLIKERDFKPNLDTYLTGRASGTEK